MVDEFGHSVMAGEMYAKVVYLQISVERKKIVKYQKPKKYQVIVIHTYKIFVTNNTMNEDLSLSSEEYHLVFQAAL